MRNYYALSILVITLSVIAPTSSGAEQKGPDGVRISYSLARQQVTLHEPILLTLRVKNMLSQAITLDLGQDREGEFSFTLTTPKGAVIQSPGQVHEGIAMIGTVSIAPTGDLSQDLLLNERFRFDVPGKYDLEGHMTKPILAENGTSLGNDIGFHEQLNIGPRDVERLQAVCKKLVDDIDRSAAYSDAAKAAQTLSYVEDPVAVPFLSLVLTKGRLVEDIAITGLERIANKDAAEALISAMRSPNSDTALVARAALTRMHESTRNHAVRELIEHALRDSVASPGT